MKAITLAAVLAMLLVGLLGSESSVGGPMTLVLVAFLIMLAVGIYEAWSNGRGPAGWVLNIVLSVIGGIMAVSLTETCWQSPAVSMIRVR